MTDNKFTDEQIMKALKCCGDGAATSLCSGDGCPYLNEPDCLTELPRDALDLINRQAGGDCGAARANKQNRKEIDGGEQ